MNSTVKLSLFILSAGVISAFGFWHFTPNDEVEFVEAEITPVTLTKVALNSATWQDIPAFVELAQASNSANDNAIASIDSENPASIYLKGLLYLSNQDVAAAIDTFDTIALTDLPPSRIYLPFRLSEARGNADNRYETALRDAALDGFLPPIQTARVGAKIGDLSLALNEYLKSDPSTWSTYDLKTFKLMLLHDGLKREARAIFTAAAKGTRLRDDIKKSLNSLLQDNETDELQITKLMQSLGSDVNAQRSFASALKTVYKTRSQFVQKEYYELVYSYEDKDTLSVTDEANLLLFLSSVAIKNSDETNRWGHELKRRFQDKEVKTWINHMMNQSL
ncbi:MAG: hypothetical protein ACKVKL_14150 [Pseudomonadales bacterium]|jgi:hypothetical protein|tara:strand:- start:6485 stop:7489 length:1005 start_codon:yes stop_codon:yes gene_type:complete